MTEWEREIRCLELVNNSDVPSTVRTFLLEHSVIHYKTTAVYNQLEQKGDEDLSSSEEDILLASPDEELKADFDQTAKASKISKAVLTDQYFKRCKNLYPFENNAKYDLKFLQQHWRIHAVYNDRSSMKIMRSDSFIKLYSELLDINRYHSVVQKAKLKNDPTIANAYSDWVKRMQTKHALLYGIPTTIFDMFHSLHKALFCPKINALVSEMQITTESYHGIFDLFFDDFSFLRTKRMPMPMNYQHKTRLPDLQVSVIDREGEQLPFLLTEDWSLGASKGKDDDEFIEHKDSLKILQLMRLALTRRIELHPSLTSLLCFGFLNVDYHIVPLHMEANFEPNRYSTFKVTSYQPLNIHPDRPFKERKGDLLRLLSYLQTIRMYGLTLQQELDRLPMKEETEDDQNPIVSPAKGLAKSGSSSAAKSSGTSADKKN